MTQVAGSIRCKSTPTSRHSDRTLDAAASPVPMHAAYCREAARKRQPTATTRRGRVPQLSKCPRRTAPPLRTTARLRHQSRHHSHQAMSSDSDGDEVDAFSAVLRKFLPGGLGEPTEAVTTPTSGARAAVRRRRTGDALHRDGRAARRGAGDALDAWRAARRGDGDARVHARRGDGDARGPRPDRLPGRRRRARGDGAGHARRARHARGRAARRRGRARPPV